MISRKRVYADDINLVRDCVRLIARLLGQFGFGLGFPISWDSVHARKAARN